MRVPTHTIYLKCKRGDLVIELASILASATANHTNSIEKCQKPFAVLSCAEPSFIIASFVLSLLSSAVSFAFLVSGFLRIFSFSCETFRFVGLLWDLNTCSRFFKIYDCRQKSDAFNPYEQNWMVILKMQSKKRVISSRVSRLTIAKCFFEGSCRVQLLSA